MNQGGSEGPRNLSSSCPNVARIGEKGATRKSQYARQFE